MWTIPRIWEGSDVWILGGGPSVPIEFNIPDQVIQKVIKGSSPALYSPYMEKLHSKHVIGINVAYLIGTWIDIVFFGDTKFWLERQNSLANFPGIKVSCHSGVNKFDWVKYCPHDKNHPKGISMVPGRVSWNENSGAAAISLAAQSGAKRIILLGFDMKLNGNNQQHWHNIYGKSTSKRFYAHMIGFKQIAIDAKKLGIEIINASPDSAIQEFKKVKVKDIL